ncbi:MAG: serine/threonine protein kinase [Clostridia bacterium]|nr:serine/threonine protein kinase [Clostridia bacterium]
MSDIKEYIDKTLQEEYTYLKTLSETSINTLKLYQHNSSGKKLVTIESKYRNDEVFRALRGLNTHGYTPRIYEVASEEDFLFVLEEFIEGEPLSDYLTGKKELSKPQIVDILIDLCTALEILHSYKIVHRDIKPENVIIGKENACLIDFSVAKMISNKSADTVSLGTAGFAAPEQYGVAQSQPTADIYALGVLANILILGKHPTSGVPKGYLGSIIKKCTNIQTSKRYQSAGELKKALLKVKKISK